MGYSGQGRTMPFKVGETTTVSIMMKGANVCGAGGSGGGGTGGSNNCTGTQTPPGTPPTLTCCTEYDHTLQGIACDDNDTYIYSLTFSPDGKYLISGGDDGRYVLWNFDGKKLTAEGHNISGGLYGYGAISPDGTKLALGGLDVHLFSVGNWADLGSLTIDYFSYGVGFSPDNLRVVDIDSGSIYVHTVADMTQAAKASLPQSAWALAVAPVLVNGGLQAAVPSPSGFVVVYNMSDPTVIGTPITLDISLNGIWAAAFSPDARKLAVGGYDSFVRIWNTPLTAASDVPAASFTVDDVNMSEDVQYIAWSPDGRYIAVASGFSTGHVSIWEVATMTKIASYPVGPNFPMSVAFSPAGNAIAVGEHGCGKFLLCAQ
jgi:WD40 repeat protein